MGISEGDELEGDDGDVEEDEGGTRENAAPGGFFDAEAGVEGSWGEEGVAAFGGGVVDPGDDLLVKEERASAGVVVFERVDGDDFEVEEVAESDGDVDPSGRGQLVCFGVEPLGPEAQGGDVNPGEVEGGLDALEIESVAFEPDETSI